jgi:hypothetical protein
MDIKTLVPGLTKISLPYRDCRVVGITKECYVTTLWTDPDNGVLMEQWGDQYEPHALGNFRYLHIEDPEEGLATYENVIVKNGILYQVTLP